MPATERELTNTVAIALFVGKQLSYCTTALKYVVTDKFPMSAPVRVVEVMAIFSTPVVNTALVAFCH